jgi:uncharacterized membrane protein
MSVAAILWPKGRVQLDRTQLQLPMAIYLGNFVFAAVLSIGGNIWIPMLLGIAVGIVPLFLLWLAAKPTSDDTATPSDIELLAEPEYVSSGN